MKQMLDKRANGSGSAAALMIVAALLAGCDQNKITDEDITAVTEQQVADAIGTTETVIVDVRRPTRYAEEHIPGAVNIYLPDIRRFDGRLATAKKIFVYGQGWEDRLASAGVKKMLALGYSNVFEFRGGLQVWKDAGRQVESSPAPESVRPDTSK